MCEDEAEDSKSGAPGSGTRFISATGTAVYSGLKRFAEWIREDDLTVTWDEVTTITLIILMSIWLAGFL